MKSKKTLSIIPYYGGKAKMASFIADRLEYSCDIFIELFGGACRTLLNKDPHKVEIYNEYDPCLCTLMEVLSNKDTAQQLIDRLYYETEPTREQFLKARELYNNRRFQEDNKIRIKKDIEKIIWVCRNEKLKKQKNDGIIENCNKDINNIDIDLAMATYLTYTLSYSGIGKGYVDGKFKSDKHYRNRILNLYACADRLRGLIVTNLDAMMFFEEQEVENNSIFQWINNPNVILFLDPSYFSLKNKKEKNRNLGKSYAKSFEKEEHEKFLKDIQCAKCKIMVCNYCSELYDIYLTIKNGWRKEVYLTKTTVYNYPKTQKSNERLEVIWCNY